MNASTGPRFELRSRLTRLVCEAEQLRDEVGGELSASRLAMIERIEEEAYAIGGLIDRSDSAGHLDPKRESVPTAILSRDALYEPVLDRLRETSEVPLEMFANVDSAASWAERYSAERVIADVIFDGVCGVGPANVVAQASAARDVCIGLVSVYQSPAFGVRMGFSGVIDAAAGVDSLVAMRDTFDVPIETVGVLGDPSVLAFGDTAERVVTDSPPDVDLVVVTESRAATLTPAALDRLRGTTMAAVRPVVLAPEHEPPLPESGWLPAIGADRYLVRPPTYLGLVATMRAAYDDHPPWALDVG